MKKYYLFMLVILSVAIGRSQCVIDTSRLAMPGAYPAADHLPHIVRDSLYDQTVQGRIFDTINQTFGGFVSVTVTIDSLRLDSIAGLPTGITWIKNPNVLLGGSFGCIEFTGTTSDTVGLYNLEAFGTFWAHLVIPILGTDSNVVQTGSLNRYAPFRNYYLVVDSAQQPLSVTIDSTSPCFGQQNGNIIAMPSGGSPVNPYTYIWNTGSTFYNLGTVGAGTYSVTVTSGTETATATATISEPSAPVSAALTSTGSTGNDGTATAVAAGGVPPYTYRWNNGGRTDTISGLAPGTYRVRITDASGCIYNDSVVVANLTGIISINDQNTRLSVFPNPANSVMNLLIETPGAVAMRVEILDITGRLVYNNSVTSSGRYQLPVNVKDFKAGVYVLRVVAGNNSVHQRFVVAH